MEEITSSAIDVNTAIADEEADILNDSFGALSCEENVDNDDNDDNDDKGIDNIQEVDLSDCAPAVKTYIKKLVAENERLKKRIQESEKNFPDALVLTDQQKNELAAIGVGAEDDKMFIHRLIDFAFPVAELRYQKGNSTSTKKNHLQLYVKKNKKNRKN